LLRICSVHNTKTWRMNGEKKVIEFDPESKRGGKFHE
jgi:hypothetical protein